MLIRQLLVFPERCASPANSLAGEVSTASGEQARGIEQVSTAVAEMDRVTQSNVAHAEQSSSASKTMASQAAELHAMVDALVALVHGSANGTVAAGPALMAPRRPLLPARSPEHVPS